MLLKKNDINKFSILFLRWGITQCIQAKGGFQAPVQCFSLSTTLSLQRIDQLKTNGMQYSWYLYSTKGRNPQSSDWNLLRADTPQQQILLPHHRTMRQPDVRTWQEVYMDIRLPGASQYFYSLQAPSCSMESLFRWNPVAAPAQPPMLL